MVVAEEEDETEEEDATEEQDPPPTAPSVPDDLNELLGNIAAQLTVEFEETVDTWHPAGKVTLTQLTLTACLAMALPNLDHTPGPDPDRAGGRWTRRESTRCAVPCAPPASYRPHPRLC